jgi:HEAT repeat protein
MGLFGPPDVGKLKAKRDVKGLINALGYRKEPTIQRAAAEALGALGDTRAAPALIAALKSGYSSADLRQVTAVALGQIGDARAVEALVDALKDKERNVREAAAEALVRIGAPAIPSLIAAAQDPAVRGDVVKALGQIGAPAVEPLIAALKDGDESVRDAAAVVLGQAGDPRAVEPLIATFKEEHWSYVRDDLPAAQALGQIGAPAVEPLIAALKHEDWRMRQAAAKALKHIGDPRAVEPLIAALKDEDARMRQAAAEALGQIGDPRATEPLIAALKNEDWRMRQAVATALGQIGGPRAVEPLIAALRDDDERVRAATAAALGQAGDPRAVGPLITLMGSSLDLPQAVQALGRIGAPAVELLLAALKDAKSNVRWAAAKALVDIYRSGKIDAKQKQMILAQRGVITRAHQDQETRVNHYDYRSHSDHECGGAGHIDHPAGNFHDDHSGHADNSGIGVVFPL